MRGTQLPSSVKTTGLPWEFPIGRQEKDTQTLQMAMEKCQVVNIGVLMADQG